MARRRREAELTRETVVSFRDEVRRNRDAVRQLLPYHRATSDALAAAWTAHLRSGAVLSIEQLRAEGHYDGPRFVDYSATAYQLAIATQSLRNLDPSLALLVSRVYERQGIIARYQEQVMASLLGAVPDQRGDMMRAAFVLVEGMAEMCNHETGLVAEYDALLTRLEATLHR